AYEYSLAEFVGFDQACEMGCAKENELALDPAYFYRLMANNEYFNAVSVLPKRASNSNEMTRYRYDVVLYSCAHTTVNDGVFDNSPSVDSMSGLKQLLKANSE